MVQIPFWLISIINFVLIYFIYVNTWMHKELGWLLILAEVSAIGSLHFLASSIINSWSGILIPIETVFGFNSTGSVDLRSNTNVTGPGNKLESWLLFKVIFDHLLLIVYFFK